jgi:plastocyanin
MRRRPPRLASLFVAAIALVATVAGCGGGDDGGSDSAEPGVVEVGDNFFEPKEVEIDVGDTVTWRFDGEIDHNVTSDEKDLFRSDTMDSGEFEHTFDDAGEFSYTCTLHTGMVGTVVVDEL